MVGVLTLVLLIGCSNDNARIGVAEVSGFETSVTVYPEVVHSYDIIPLEQTDGCILTGIRKIAKVDSSYIVFDNYNNLIVRYGTDGKFLNR